MEIKNLSYIAITVRLHGILLFQECVHRWKFFQKHSNYTKHKKIKGIAMGTFDVAVIIFVVVFVFMFTRGGQ